ncbi:MAG: (2Fe-2S)-binding protein [Flavobacteriaceae bacterium]|nr:(2Fe-2S)-binding protein [Flavobacteriaceae bacterium]
MPTVSIDGQQVVYQVSENERIFDALEKRGKELPHGCLAGSCGACRVEILNGAENLSEPDILESNTIKAIIDNYERMHGKGSAKGKVIRLSCRAKILGDIKIKLIS